MPAFRNLVLLFLLACIAQHVSEAGSDKGREKKGKTDGVDSSSGSRTPRGNDNVPKGKFTTKDKAQCTWKAEGTDTYIMTITCKKGKKSSECTYTARPDTCPGYSGNTKGYWKQIARDLKKQKKLCQDPGALIKAGMCKRAPQDAHFKLEDATPNVDLTKVVEQRKPVDGKEQVSTSTKRTTTVSAPVGAKDTSCTERVDHKKLAEEKCGSWASLCNFLFTIVQSGDC
ncbi:fibroblast growth factor-binding protein 1 [Alosa alosa]|nr:fibroblast growth factor-binding protein 1 [Alosa sapidissima]XP_048113125.1 fibroblast growth factor-binding protein 1 [Alosa alosa]